MYRNAATTLGIEHAKITVAAPIPVTGESALAGIYYSLEQNGAKSQMKAKSLLRKSLKPFPKSMMRIQVRVTMMRISLM